MYQSEQINELIGALAKAQGEICPAIKDSANPFFKSKYADLSSVMNACKEPLSKNGLAVLQTTDYKEGQLFLLTTLAHSSGQWMRSLLPVVTEKNNAQGIGSAITYMRRYALSAMVGITGEDDDGNASCSMPEKKIEIKSYVSKDLASNLATLLDNCDPKFRNNITNYYFNDCKISTWEQLPKDRYETAYNSILTHIKSRKPEMAGSV
jgi:hypothetical protein